MNSNEIMILLLVVVAIIITIPQQTAIFPIMPKQHELILSTPGQPQQQIYFTSTRMS